ncbi:[protein-PII] uridylyltransferase [Gordonia neofelifaecis]|uniref:Bifunctional uridylyltransferase/uridylyl-removing enzyme n=1 Tax=Gordonia neofelifaecis NRRL B-59395 TaxID=644548 RepID=F1YI88_9ACTN|nr:[protein-PII] uridylyltransferase [Gordonia neofelifaecis]EGD55642.1 PII uridylyl-transferase [Gordonia neofelifaecis NRRL B-59395]
MNADRKPSEPGRAPDPTSGATLGAARSILLHDDSLTGADQRDAIAGLFEDWLVARAEALGITDRSGFAVVAVGSLGRREMVGYSDLDLILVHDDRYPERLSEVADGLWYPLWDAGISLDHSVRSVPEALRVTREDATAALGLLDSRFIAGDRDLADLMTVSVRNLWRSEARLRLPQVIEAAQDRWRRTGDIAHRAEPDLKSGRGGLRDIQLLNALAVAQLTDGLARLDPGSAGSPLPAAYEFLLGARGEAHRIAGRARDQIRAQDADEIAVGLGVADRFELARRISDAGRTTSYAVDAGLRTAQNAVSRRGFSRLRRATMRRPLDEGVVEQGGEVVLARSAIPSQDPGLVLRVAAAAARNRLPINGPALERLAAYGAAMPEPWSAEALSDLLVLLAAGHDMAGPVEALDRAGLWGRMFPEWEHVRDLPPRDGIHTWTVDRHLIETVAGAAELTTSVSRPDLLLLGALLHDIGKGLGGDHCAVGADLADTVGRRLGLWEPDRRILSEMVRHHLLLHRVVTRRDPADPAVVAHVAETLGGSAVLAELLGALADADSRATGPGVWSEWKATLISGLVERVVAHIGGAPVTAPDPIAPEFRELAEHGGLHVRLNPGDGPNMTVVTMIAPDRPGLLSKMAGVLALSGLQSHSATVGVHAGHAVDSFVVMPTFGGPPDAVLLRQRLVAVLGGGRDPVAELAARAAARQPEAGLSGRPAVPVSRIAAPPRVRWLSGPDGHPLLELRAADDEGLLARVTAELERSDADIAWATVSTLGATAVDTFCVDLRRDDAAARESIAAAVLAVCAPVR